jgi:transcription-repair coupling factor (superfamily II helicase)
VSTSISGRAGHAQRNTIIINGATPFGLSQLTDKAAWGARSRGPTILMYRALALPKRAEAAFGNRRVLDIGSGFKVAERDRRFAAREHSGARASGNIMEVGSTYMPMLEDARAG